MDGFFNPGYYEPFTAKINPSLPPPPKNVPLPTEVAVMLVMLKNSQNKVVENFMAPMKSKINLNLMVLTAVANWATTPAATPDQIIWTYYLIGEFSRQVYKESIQNRLDFDGATNSIVFDRVMNSLKAKVGMP